jgi:hypothetical protein
LGKDVGGVMLINQETEEKRVAVTAAIAALAEGVRLLGSKGTNEWALYQSVSAMMDRKAFDMIIAELIEQKTFKRDANRLTYCGPKPLQTKDLFSFEK